MLPPSRIDVEKEHLLISQSTHIVLQLQQVAITDDDIKQQEAKVAGARRKVEELLAAIEKSDQESLRNERPLSSVPSEVRVCSTLTTGHFGDYCHWIICTGIV